MLRFQSRSVWPGCRLDGCRVSQHTSIRTKGCRLSKHYTWLKNGWTYVTFSVYYYWYHQLHKYTQYIAGHKSFPRLKKAKPCCWESHPPATAWPMVVETPRVGIWRHAANSASAAGYFPQAEKVGDLHQEFQESRVGYLCIKQFDCKPLKEDGILDSQIEIFSSAASLGFFSPIFSRWNWQLQTPMSHVDIQVDHIPQLDIQVNQVTKPKDRKWDIPISKLSSKTHLSESHQKNNQALTVGLATRVFPNFPTLQTL